MLQCDGQEQIRILARGDTNRDQATIHQYYQVPDTIIQMTVDRVRRLPRQDYCHVGVQSLDLMEYIQEPSPQEERSKGSYYCGRQNGAGGG